MGSEMCIRDRYSCIYAKILGLVLLVNSVAAIFVTISCIYVKILGLVLLVNSVAAIFVTGLYAV